MINEFEELKICYEEELDLTNYNTMKLNSMCYVMVHPRDVQELKSILNIAKKYKTKFMILGNGSNMILPEYYNGIIIKLDKFKKMILSGCKIYVEAGYMLNKLAIKMSELGFTGLEWATGIPGTIGGAIYSNAEAYKCPMSGIVRDIVVFDGEDIKLYSNADAEFEYRSSVFRGNPNLIILSCNIELKKEDTNTIKNLITERTKRRFDTQPLSYPSCGSVFRNPELAPAGKLIEDLGFKGYKIGGAKVSEKHANFIINDGDATSKDVIKLIKKITKEVKKAYNVDLILEQEIVK